MNILNKDVTPNGIPFQLEDWSEDFTSSPYGATIGAYPRRYKHVRCQCDFKNNHEALKAFEKLSAGELTIFDFNFTVMIAGGNRVSIRENFNIEKFEMIYGKI